MTPPRTYNRGDEEQANRGPTQECRVHGIECLIDCQGEYAVPQVSSHDSARPTHSSSYWTKNRSSPFFAFRANVIIARSYILNKNGSGTTSRLEPEEFIRQPREAWEVTKSGMSNLFKLL
jgi:hypothetical protein